MAKKRPAAKAKGAEGEMKSFLALPNRFSETAVLREVHETAEDLWKVEVPEALERKYQPYQVILGESGKVGFTYATAANAAVDQVNRHYGGKASVLSREGRSKAEVAAFLSTLQREEIDALDDSVKQRIIAALMKGLEST